MGRIAAVVILALVSCVLCNTTPTPAGLTTPADNADETCDLTTPLLVAERSKSRTCFNEVVDTYISNPTVNRTYHCFNSSDFTTTLTAYYAKVNQQCNKTISIKKLTEFVDFSLKNGKYKEFYNDSECFKKLKPQISQCVKDNVGFFNETENGKHSSWLSKVFLTYNDRTCELATEVKDCVVDVLKVCKPTTRQYVASLFDFSLKNCINSTNTTPNKAGRTGSIPVPLLSIGISLTALLSIPSIFVVC